MTTYYIGADVHSNSIEMAILKRKKIVKRYKIPATIYAASQVLDSLGPKKYIAVEEGPMAGWLYRNLRQKVERFVVADPRRNKLISSDGDHDDKIDSAKLAMLLAGGYLREVYHSDDEHRVELKHWVSLYHDRVRDAVRNINKIRARCRMHGLTIPRKVLRQSEHRDLWLSKLKQPALAKQLLMLWLGYDATAKQTRIAKQHLLSLSKKYPRRGC
jgi:transposase